MARLSLILTFILHQNRRGLRTRQNRRGVWNEYSKQCKKASGMDFDDLLLNFYYMLKSNPGVARKIANEYDHLLVDEYQDTCPIQAYTIRELLKANPKLKLFIVGDTRQSIYSFRAAQVKLLTEAEKMFGDFDTVELVENYRSHPKLIDFNNIFAPNMAEQITSGILKSGRPNDFDNVETPLVEGHQFASDREEAQWILGKISQLLNDGVEPENVYVLYRNRNAVKLIEDELKRSLIQFEMIGERNFYECLEVRDAVAFFRTLVRPRDVLAWARLCNAATFGVRGVYLREKHLETGAAPIDIIKGRVNKNNADKISSFMQFHSDCVKDLHKTDVEWRELFRKSVHPTLTLRDIDYHIDKDSRARNEYLQWRGEFLVEKVGEILEIYVEHVLHSYQVLDERASRGDDRKDPETITANRVTNIVSVFNEILTRLENTEDLSAIVDDVLTRDTPQRNERSGAVKLMTGHASKGLESEHVILAGCDTSIWGDRMKMTEENKAEEDRIYYVMATRAEQRLYMTMSNFRVVNGEPVPARPYEPIYEHLLDAQKMGLAVFHSHVKSREHTNNIHSVNDNSSTPDRINSNQKGSPALNGVLQRIASNMAGGENTNKNGEEIVNFSDFDQNIDESYGVVYKS